MAYSQNDRRWAQATLGFGPGKIGPYGCFLTAYANILTWAGHQITPLELNDVMKQRGYFTQDLINNHQAPNLIAPQNLEWLGEVHWDNPPRPAPLDFFNDIRDPDITYAILIDASHAPGVQTHFTQVVGKTGNDLIIDDSWDGNRKRLSLYGDPSVIIQAAYKYRKKGQQMADRLATDDEIAMIVHHAYYPKPEYPLVWQDKDAFTRTLGYLRGNTFEGVFRAVFSNNERDTYMQALGDIKGPYAARDALEKAKTEPLVRMATALETIAKK